MSLLQEFEYLPEHVQIRIATDFSFAVNTGVQTQSSYAVSVPLYNTPAPRTPGD